jgi:hypothetical protein
LLTRGLHRRKAPISNVVVVLFQYPIRLHRY